MNFIRKVTGSPPPDEEIYLGKIEKDLQQVIKDV